MTSTNDAVPEVLASSWAEFCETICNGGARRKLIIDCDAGTDDTEAILMCLNCPNVDVVAITCVNGNIHRDQVIHNVRRVLSLCGRTDIPVFAGAVAPLVAPLEDASFFHGADGLGDADTKGEAPESEWPPLQEENAVDALIRICREGVKPTAEGDNVHQVHIAQLADALETKEQQQRKFMKALASKGDYEGARRIDLDIKDTSSRIMSLRRAAETIGHGECYPTVEVLALGPLTNLAIAARLNVEFPATVKHLFIMGGTYRARGNVPYNASSEFNAHADPEALDICMRAFMRPVLVTWEACLDHALPWDRVHAWRDKPTKKAAFITKIMHHTRALCEREGWPFVPADPLAAAVCLYPDIVTEKGAQLHYVEVELAGAKTRSQSIADLEDMTKCVRNCWLITDVNSDRLFHAFCSITDE